MITTPGGKLGTYSSKVSWPKVRSHLTNHEKSFCRACRKRIPLPTRGRVLGGFLRLGLSARTGHYRETGEGGGWNQPGLPQRSPTSRDATLAKDGPQDQSDHGEPDSPSEERHCHDAILGGIEPITGCSFGECSASASAVWVQISSRRGETSCVCNTTLGYDAGVGVVAWTDVCQLQLSADEPLPTLSSCLGFSCGVLERCRLDGPCTAATLLARPPVALETGLHSTLRGLQIRCKRRVGRYEAIGYVHCVLPRSQQNTLVTSTLHPHKLFSRELIFPASSRTSKSIPS